LTAIQLLIGWQSEEHRQGDRIRASLQNHEVQYIAKEFGISGCVRRCSCGRPNARKDLRGIQAKEHPLIC